MKDSILAVVFMIDTHRFALAAACVDFVTRAVALTPLPHAPDVVAGLVNVRGTVVPAFSLRRRSGFSDRPLTHGDHLIIARTARRSMALIADNIVGLFPFRTDAFAAAEEILKGLPHVAGVLKDTDGMILIHDLERFLSLEEEHALERALEAGTP